ncbi:MAG: hypothetical protein HYU81_00245 [Candidatus Brennerbacteria bacterium]|nr:hypothetical protein [Candidatus Brennerbacteria bacterium]
MEREIFQDKKETMNTRGSITFAWSVIGLTSTLLMAGFAFFAYALSHLP